VVVLWRTDSDGFLFCRAERSSARLLLPVVSQDFPIVALLHFKECINLLTCKPTVLEEIFPKARLEPALLSQKSQEIIRFKVPLADGTFTEFFSQASGGEDFSDVLKGEQVPFQGNLAEKRALASLPQKGLDIGFPGNQAGIEEKLPEKQVSPGG